MASGRAGGQPGAVSSGAAKSGRILLLLGAVLLCIPVIGPGIGILLGWLMGLIMIVLAVVALCQGATGQGILILMGTFLLLPICFLIGGAQLDWFHRQRRLVSMAFLCHGALMLKLAKGLLRQSRCQS